MNTRDAYVEKLKAQLDEWDDELDRLDAKAFEAEANEKIKYEEMIKKICHEHEEAQQMLSEIRETSEDAWEELKEGTENVWNSLKESLRKASFEFKKVHREGMEE